MGSGIDDFPDLGLQEDQGKPDEKKVKTFSFGGNEDTPDDDDDDLDEEERALSSRTPRAIRHAVGARSRRAWRKIG